MSCDAVEGGATIDMSLSQTIQWFPGHMAKTKRKIQSDLKFIDLVAEIIDARAPISSQNPDLMALLSAKPKIVLLNKADMADPVLNLAWLKFFSKQDKTQALAVDCKSGKGLDKFIPSLKLILKQDLDSFKSKGMQKRIRVMVVGIPNVGKSSFINRMVKAKKAKVENRPGITRTNQWFLAKDNIEILDTPGMLWPKFEDAKVGENLALIGSIKAQILDSEILAHKLIEKLLRFYPDSLKNRFDIEVPSDPNEGTAEQVLNLVAKKRAMFLSGGKLDTERAAKTLLEEFRTAKLGRITLERDKDVVRMSPKK
jgi:ribosome biogenesis GTPase A